MFQLEREPEPVQWIVPQRDDDSTGPFLRIVVVVMLVVVLVGGGVALWAANQVVRPIYDIIEDIRHISKGDLKHRTRARGGGEVELLGRSIDRMTRELTEAQDAELQLSIREREMSLASGVREALLPVATPLVEGYDIGSAHLQGHFGGDFHEYVELEDGRVGLLVCDVSGEGVPAALIGATARAYLRAALAQGGDVGDAFRAVNRELVRDVRRGMYVTALYALLDPRTARVTVACAGHKVPLLRYTAADENLRLLHPEGIALGFDKGPVFDRRLEVEEIEMSVGDRLLLVNSGPVLVANADGVELGEKAFYANVMRRAKLDTPKFLKGVRNVLLEWAGTDGPNVDVSLVTVSREA
jgi:serine phosphatase RsbU (regulator of sigma subunit)